MAGPDNLEVKLAAGVLSLSLAGFVGIQTYEGKRNTAYLDTGNVVTVCYGHTATAKMGQRLSDATCDFLLKQDVRHAEAAVKRHVTVPVTQGQYDALVSFTFNLGEKQLANSTLLRKLNAGDCFGAAAQFDRWVYDNGVIYKGLVKRRANERAKFEPGCKP